MSFVVFLLLIAGIASLVFLVAGGLLEPHPVIKSWEPIRPLFDAMEVEIVTRISVAGGAALVGVVMLYVLLRPLGPAPDDNSGLHRLASDDRGFVVIHSSGVATVATQAALSSHGVMEAEVEVRGTGASPVRLVVDAHVYLGADVKKAGDEVRDNVQEAVERMVGVDVRDVAVTVHVVQPNEFSKVLLR